MSERKHLIKAARRVPVDDILTILHRDEDMIDDYFLVYNADLDVWFIECRSRTNGLGTMTIEDPVLDMACIEYMKTHGYLMFESDAEASAHIKAQGWTATR